MNVNTYYYNNHTQIHRPNKKFPKRTSFGGGFKPTAKISEAVVNKIEVFTLLFMGAMFLYGFMKSQIEKSPDKDNINGINVEYFNVKPETKESITQCCEEFTSNLNENNNFLKGTNLIITDKPSSLDNNNDDFFKKFVKENYTMNSINGLSFYSDSRLPRSIIIGESTHINDMKYLGKSSYTPLLRHSLMHEVGHQFSEYFGHNHNDKFALELDSLLEVKNTDPCENPCWYNFNDEVELEIAKKYAQNNELADKEAFKKALLKDYKNLARIITDEPENLPLNIDYYTNGIDFSWEITLQDVEDAYMARSEVYANLFSYAVGEDNSDKTNFINAFPNSFEVVKKDIKTYLGDGFVKM